MRIKKKLQSFLPVMLSVTAGLLLAVMPLASVQAATNPTPKAQVSFTFDDGLASALTQAAPVLQKYGIQGTEYVTTNCVGSKNTCPADTAATYMTWAQVKQLQNTYGWEIGAHTMNHNPLTTLTTAKQEQEISGSKQALAAQGITATSFATPEGDYNQRTLELIAKYFTSHRGFHDTGLNGWPYSDYLIRVQQVQVGVSVAQVKASIDNAIANKQWVVLVFHDIKKTPSKDPEDYNYSTADLEQIAAYVQSKQRSGLITPTRVKDSTVSNTTNMLPNGGFTSGITGGWSTNTPANVVTDSANNGAFPEAARSVKFTSGTANTHLFSPKVGVSNATTYMFKNFITVKQITSGEFGFYIDEYDAGGNWISGQWKGAERTAFAENFNFSYTPSSAAVATASLQIYATGNPGITAYVDNVQMFPLTTTVIPAPVNLVANGTFDAGISNGWTADSTTGVVADAGSHGSSANPVNSVKMTAAGNNVHLFSPKVTVSATATYSIGLYCSITALTTGEVGFYIDEYDAGGNWVSGQWKTARYGVGAAQTAMTYKPSSANVRTASFQIYATGTGIQAYVDDVKWYAL